jgi:hypothetical protein
VVFLDHVLSAAGIEVQSDKVTCVRDWPRPTNLTELRAFLGTCSYYRRFIVGFADLATPLHFLQRKHVPFQWTSKQEEAFNRLKEKLTSAPVLGMPMDDGLFYLDSDASEFALGAVLSQIQNGSEMVIAYSSRVLSKAERNYDVTKKELLGAVNGLKSFNTTLRASDRSRCASMASKDTRTHGSTGALADVYRAFRLRCTTSGGNWSWKC